MHLQFFSTDSSTLDLSSEEGSRLATGSKSMFFVPVASMVAFSVISSAANDPSTLLEKEVSSIDRLASGGVKLQTKLNSSDVYHLPQNLLENAMMDFAQLTPRDFVVLALNFEFANTRSTSNVDSADSLLHEFQNADATLEQNDSIELEETDLLKQYHWTVLSGLKDFVKNALELKLAVFRISADSKTVN